MKRLLVIFLIFIIASISACSNQKTEDSSGIAENIPTEPATDDAVDSVGDGLSEVDSIEDELSNEELNDLDAGLSDIENI